ncbi:MAG: hypothetical protein P8J91_08505 [Pirellulaceae bacterium]|nr:hypothetical protein [Pirellulaceae bacterium]
MKLRNKGRTFVAFAVTLLVIKNAVAQDDPGRTSEIERLKFLGKPVLVKDLNAEPIPDFDNAAWWLSQAAAGQKTLVTASEGELDLTQNLNEELIKKFDSLAMEATYRQIARAISAPTYVPLIKLTPSNFESFNDEDRTKMRLFARVLYYRGAVEIAKGRPQEAANTALQIIRLSRQPNHYFGLVGFLVRKALQNMGTSLLLKALETEAINDTALLKTLQTELSALDNLDDLVETIDSERVFGLHALNTQGGFTKIWNTEPYLKTMRLAQQELALPIAEHRELFDGNSTGRTLTDQLLPALKMARQAAHRELTAVRQLRIRIAFLQQPKAVTVESLDLPAPTKTDPTTGLTMGVKSTDE